MEKSTEPQVTSSFIGRQVPAISWWLVGQGPEVEGLVGRVVVVVVVVAVVEVLVLVSVVVDSVDVDVEVDVSIN